MSRARFVDMREAESTTLAEALDRYLSEVTSTKKGAKQEQVRIRKWRAHKLASKALAAIRSSDSDSAPQPGGDQPTLHSGNKGMGYRRAGQPVPGDQDAEGQ